VILANRVPVAKDELLDYLIEGISNTQLRNQARLMKFRSGAELLEAFESVMVRREDEKAAAVRAGGTRWRRGGAGASAGARPMEGRGSEEERTAAGRPELATERRRCYRCGEARHVAAGCGRPSARRACYVCGSSEHLAAGCPERGRSTAARGTKSTEIALTSVARPLLPGSYMVSVSISAVDERGGYNRVDDAMIDTGSPISLIKDSVVPSELCVPVGDNAERFFGINSVHRLVLSIFFIVA